MHMILIFEINYLQPIIATDNIKLHMNQIEYV